MPLLLGILIFICGYWISTELFITLGVCNIILGLLLFILGLLFLIDSIIKEFNNVNKINVKEILLSLGILLVNFPAAALAIHFADIESYTVTIENDSNFRITDLVLVEQDKSHQIPVIEPHQQLTEKVHFNYEGSVNYRLSINSINQEGVLFGYVTDGISDDAVIKIKKDSSIEIYRPKYDHQ